MIPGMFIIDFLRRTTAVRQYTRYFIFPRRLAIDAARSRVQGEVGTEERVVIESDIKNWLESLNLYSPELLHAQVEAVDILTDHYQQLLNADGNDLSALIQNAYPNRESFASFVDRITAAEDNIDRIIK